jgi:hypothetical protein
LLSLPLALLMACLRLGARVQANKTPTLLI